LDGNRHEERLRKKTGLTPDDIVVAYVQAEGDAKALVEKYEDELKKTSLIKEVIFEDVPEGQEVSVDEMSFKVSLEK